MVMWLHAYSMSSNPRVIAWCFTGEGENRSSTSTCIRSDLDTEKWSFRLKFNSGRVMTLAWFIQLSHSMPNLIQFASSSLRIKASSSIAPAARQLNVNLPPILLHPSFPSLQCFPLLRLPPMSGPLGGRKLLTLNLNRSSKLSASLSALVLVLGWGQRAKPVQSVQSC